MKRLLFSFLSIALFACQNDSFSNEIQTTIIDSSLIKKTNQSNRKIPPIKKTAAYALTLVDFLRIRDKPDSKNSTVVATTREGSYLLLTGKKSTHTETIKLRGKEYNEHWFEVDLKFAKGWIYGGAIKQVSQKAQKDKYPFATTTSIPKDWSSRYSEENLNKIQKAVILFQNTKNASQLIHFYTNELPILVNILQEKMYYTNDGSTQDIASENFVKNGLPFLTLDQLCSQCKFEYYANFTNFQTIAKTTPSDKDDIFFELLVEIFGEYDAMHPSLTVHDCDFCWHVNLGNGEILKFTKKAINELYNYPLLQKKVLDYLIINMRGSYFMYTKEQVLKELYQINTLLKEMDWDEASQKRYEEIYTKLTSKNDYTFDCNNKDCSALVMEKLFPPDESD